MPRKKTTTRKKTKLHYQVLTRVDLGEPLGKIDPGSRVVVIELEEAQAAPLVADGVQALKPTKAAVNYPEDSPSPEPEDPPEEEPEEEPEEPEKPKDPPKDEPD